MKIERCVIKCQGCKGVASRIDDKIAFQLMRGEEEWLVPPAFECKNCRVIIFEGEFDKGRFVPPQFREESVPTLKLECPSRKAKGDSNVSARRVAQ